MPLNEDARFLVSKAEPKVGREASTSTSQTKRSEGADSKLPKVVGTFGPGNFRNSHSVSPCETPQSCLNDNVSRNKTLVLSRNIFSETKTLVLFCNIFFPKLILSFLFSRETIRLDQMTKGETIAMRAIRERQVIFFSFFLLRNY